MKGNEFKGRESGRAIRVGKWNREKVGEREGCYGMKKMYGCSENGGLCVCMSSICRLRDDDVG